MVGATRVGAAEFPILLRGFAEPRLADFDRLRLQAMDAAGIEVSILSQTARAFRGNQTPRQRLQKPSVAMTYLPAVLPSIHPATGALCLFVPAGSCCGGSELQRCVQELVFVWALGNVIFLLNDEGIHVGQGTSAIRSPKPYMHGCLAPCTPFALGCRRYRCSTRWSAVLGNELSASNLGVLCLTKDNLDSAAVLISVNPICKKVVYLMLGLQRIISNLILTRVIFNNAWRERKCRHEFFYNAFRALSFNGIDGDYAEFGCWGGMTFALAYHEARRHRHKARLWAFDSFQGLPSLKEAGDEHPVWKEGAMATSIDEFHAICTSNGIPSDAYSVVPGFYDKTLTRLSPDDAPKNIGMAYVDCDMYSSAKTVLQFLAPRLKHGMIIAFDDYFCWSASQISGERKAMLEFFANNDSWALLPYMQFGWHGNSFVVEEKRHVDF